MEVRENSGTLGKNQYHEEGGKKPEYKGKGNFKGVDFEIAAWINTNKETNEKFFSIKFQEPYVKPEVVETSGNDQEVPF